MKFEFSKIIDKIKAKTKKGVIPITERVKTFEDACNEVGVDASEWIKDKGNLGLEKDVIAYMKLCIICKALNEGWKVIYKGRKTLWFQPTFCTYTLDDLKYSYMERDEKDRAILCDGIETGVFLSDDVDSFFFGVDNRITRLCLKDPELAIYCGKQFFDIWLDFLFPDFTLTKKNKW